MSQRKVAIRLQGHTSIRLDSGRFLLLPALDQWQAVERTGPDCDPEPDRVTIKAFTRVRPLDAAVIGSTLHVTLPVQDFERLGGYLRARANEAIELAFDVDDDGAVSELLVDGSPLARQALHSDIRGLKASPASRERAG